MIVGIDGDHRAIIEYHGYDLVAKVVRSSRSAEQVGWSQQGSEQSEVLWGRSFAKWRHRAAHKAVLKKMATIVSLDRTEAIKEVEEAYRELENA